MPGCVCCSVLFLLCRVGWGQDGASLYAHSVCVFACSVHYVSLVRCRHVRVPCGLIASYSVTPQRLWFPSTPAARGMLRQGMFQCCAFCLFSRQGSMAQGDSHVRLVGGWVGPRLRTARVEVLLRFRWWFGAVPSYTGPRLWFAHGRGVLGAHTHTHVARCDAAQQPCPLCVPPHRPATSQMHQHVRTVFLCVQLRTLG